MWSISCHVNHDFESLFPATPVLRSEPPLVHFSCFLYLMDVPSSLNSPSMSISNRVGEPQQAHRIQKNKSRSRHLWAAFRSTFSTSPPATSYTQPSSSYAQPSLNRKSESWGNGSDVCYNTARLSFNFTILLLCRWFRVALRQRCPIQLHRLPIWRAVIRLNPHIMRYVPLFNLSPIILFVLNSWPHITAYGSILYGSQPTHRKLPVVNSYNIRLPYSTVRWTNHLSLCYICLPQYVRYPEI